MKNFWWAIQPRHYSHHYLPRNFGAFSSKLPFSFCSIVGKWTAMSMSNLLVVVTHVNMLTITVRENVPTSRHHNRVGKVLIAWLEQFLIEILQDVFFSFGDGNQGKPSHDSLLWWNHYQPTCCSDNAVTRVLPKMRSMREQFRGDTWMKVLSENNLFKELSLVVTLFLP